MSKSEAPKVGKQGCTLGIGHSLDIAIWDLDSCGLAALLRGELDFTQIDRRAFLGGELHLGFLR